MRAPPKARVLEGWAAFDARGQLLWGTLRPTKADALARMAQWNPDAEGGIDERFAVRPVRVIMASEPCNEKSIPS